MPPAPGTDSEATDPLASQVGSQPFSPASPASASGRGSQPLKLPSRQRTAGSSRSNGVANSSEDGSYGSGATIFNTRNRPSLVSSESYVVQHGRPKQDQRSTSTDGGLWKTFGPRLPSMPDIPSVPLLPRRSHSRKGSQQETAMRRSQDVESAVAREQTSAPESGGVSGVAAPLRQKLADIHARHPNLKDLPGPLLPIATFPNQGTGSSSEFNQDAPIWARQPFKLAYFVYFGLSVGLIFLPWFALTSLFQSQRARKTWSWKRSTLIKLYRHGTRLTFRTHTSLSRDLTKEVPHSKTVRAKFVWVDALPNDQVLGDIRSAMKLQDVKASRTCGFWYGERDGGGGVGQQATAGEKVVYHLHGGAYWIGTAHESDVTSAVNMQVLRALDGIYSSRLPDGSSRQHLQTSPPSPGSGPAHQGAKREEQRSGGHCKRSFSLDYRLCVPGKPSLGSYPAALLDALAGYRYLVRECGFEARNIILAGDSAGGNLALALCRYLRDERIEEMPGAMLLLSPWADASRSHSGPTESPNKFSTSYLNGKSDIISPSLAFRNTAVSALLGKMAARETYRNPYLSSISLQLAPERGGSGPNWGFEGFPRRVYICTGSAELSYDQHLTLAYRLAGGTKQRLPIHRGDKISVDEDPYETAARLRYPRPREHEVTLWPSAQNTPAGTPLQPPPRWNPTRAKQSSSSWTSSDGGESSGTGSGQEGRQAVSVGARVRTANGYLPTMLSRATGTHDDEAEGNAQSEADTAKETHVSLPPCSHTAANGADCKVGMDGVKEKDTLEGASVTHGGNHHSQETATPAQENGQGSTDTRWRKESSADSKPVEGNGEVKGSKDSSRRRLNESYFDVGGEDRTVVLDECRDAIHDYTLFDWYEPERGQTWARIAQWIDEEV